MKPMPISLRRRLSLSFAGITALSALVIGGVLIPILATHYATAEQTYLEAAAERSVRDLQTISWKNLDDLTARAESLASLTQARVPLSDASG